MITLIAVGDLHWRGTNPRARTDNFSEALAAKVLEIQQLARETRASAILWPGDLVDTPGIGLGTLSDLVGLLKKTPCPILAIGGNHDEWGGNPDTLGRAPFGLLCQAGYVYDVARADFMFTEGVVVTGRHYSLETDRDVREYGLFPGTRDKYAPGTCFIHLTHGMLLEQPPGFEVRHTRIRDLAGLGDQAPHVLVNGHYHLGINITEIGRTLVLNPGALCRLSAHPAEMERPIMVALITIDATEFPGSELTVRCGRVAVKMVRLKSARPGHEVLSRDHLEAVLEREERMTRFLQLLADEGEVKFLEVREIIEDIARREKLPQAVVQEALARLGQAREQIGAVQTG